MIALIHFKDKDLLIIEGSGGLRPPEGYSLGRPVATLLCLCTRFARTVLSYTPRYKCEV